MSRKIEPLDKIDRLITEKRAVPEFTEGLRKMPVYHIVALNVNTLLLSLLPERKSHFLVVPEMDTCFGWNVSSVLTRPMLVQMLRYSDQRR